MDSNQARKYFDEYLGAWTWGSFFARDIGANFRTDGRLRLTKIFNFFSVLYARMASKTGLVFKK